MGRGLVLGVRSWVLRVGGQVLGVGGRGNKSLGNIFSIGRRRTKSASTPAAARQHRNYCRRPY